MFPKSDILVISLTVLTLKFFRGNPGRITLLTLLLITAHFGFLNRNADTLIPLQDWLGSNVKSFTEAVRWPCVFLYLGFFLTPLLKTKDLREKFLRQSRLILPVLIMPLLYPLMPLMIEAAQSPDEDVLLKKIDTWLFFNNNPIELCEKLIHPILSEWMAFSYSFYGFFFLLTFAFLFLRDDETPTKELIFNTTLTFALGYWGYTLVPAKGPLFMQHFEKSLDLYYMKDIQYALADQARIERDCFPSLHTAITCVAGFSAYRYLRKFFWITLPITASIPFACIYLRYHYVIDVIAGGALALFVIKTIPLLQRRFQKTPATQNTP